jgi:branched-chain amino acid transport system substrate-binding protein
MNTKKRFRMGKAYVFISIFCLCVASAFLITKDAAANSTIKIGEIDPASGVFKLGGDQYHYCIEQAVHEQNEAGGVLGKKIELIREDGMMKPEVAVRKAKKLYLEDKVDFLCGGLGSHVYLAVAKVAEQYKKLYICTGAASDAITGSGFNRYIFRPGITGTNSSFALASYLGKQPYTKYYLINQDYAFGYDMARTFKEQLMRKKPGAQIVGEDFTPLGNKDFTAYLNKILASGAEVVYCSFVGDDLQIFLKQSHELGLAKKAFFAFFYMDPVAAQSVGEAIDGHLFANNYEVSIDTPDNRAFIKRYHARHQNLDIAYQYPCGYPGNSYNAMRFLFAVIKKAGTLETEAIIKTWEGMEFEYIATGKVKMRACDHQLLTPYFLFKGAKIPPAEQFFKIPYYLSKPIAEISAEECQVPMGTPNYNPRCK